MRGRRRREKKGYSYEVAKQQRKRLTKRERILMKLEKELKRLVEAWENPEP